MTKTEQDSEYKKHLGNKRASQIVAEKFTQRGWSQYTRAYTFTNEGISSLMSSVKHKDKKIIGIAGSGDHYIESVSAGCKEYSPVDTSILASFFFELKVASMRKLNLEEFLNFWCTGTDIPPMMYGHFSGQPISRRDNENPFANKSYERIRDELSNTARDFFDFHIPFLIHHSLGDFPAVYPFLMNLLPRNAITSMLPSLSSVDAYEKTKLALLKRETEVVKCARIEDIDASEKYDLVYLSNTPQYQAGGRILDKAKQLLAQDGRILAFNIIELGNSLPQKGLMVEEVSYLSQPASYPASTMFLPYCCILKTVDCTFPEKSSQE